MNPLEQKTRTAFRSVRYTGLGIELAVFLVCGVLAGNWIDENYETAPWGILGGVAFGVAGGVRTLTRTIKQIQRDAAAEEAAARNPTETPPSKEPKS
ncbi:AtpZ/AtpI family protein [Myxococcota bacterium]|nr:AtpZ/AtpI family protein [Myxococcota bacterium]